jgi:6-phosphogluconolactonase
MAISELKLPRGVTAHEYRTPVQLADGLANDVAEQLRTAISARGEATLVVSGGRSPVAFFQNLAKQGLDWSKVTITAGCRWNTPTAMLAC